MIVSNRYIQLARGTRLSLAIVAVLVLMSIAYIVVMPLQWRSVHIWNIEMLRGKGAYLADSDGFREHAWIRSAWLGERPIDASLARLGILVQDLSGLGGAGWIVEGGPIARVTLTGWQIDLYGREIEKSHSGLFNNHTNPQENTYDFLLIRRDSTTGEARIMKQWLGFAGSIPIGTMRYTPENGQLSVKIRNITHPVDQLLRVDTLLSAR